MIEAHARLAPSSAHRWGPGGCPGSVAMEDKYPEDGDSEQSREGTAAHHYLTETLLGREPAIGSLAPNGYPINIEMIEGAGEMLRDVGDTMLTTGPGAQMFVETRVSMADSVHPDNWGTPDVVIVDPNGAEGPALHVWDYKYGHRYVDPFMNWQLIDYAIGVLERHGLPSWFPWRITLTVAQPRNYHPTGPLREWYLSGAQLADLSAQLKAAAIEASQPDAQLRTGGHCRDCSAAMACPALQMAAMSAVDLSYRQNSVDMDAAAVGLELKILAGAAARIKARSDALEAHALGVFKRGMAVPHWQMQPVASRKRWTQKAEDIIAVGKLYGVELAKPLEAITPVQAAKAGVDEAVIMAYTESPTGAMKLVALDDTSAARVFGI